MLHTKESLLVAYGYLLLKSNEFSSSDDQLDVFAGPDCVTSGLVLKKSADAAPKKSAEKLEGPKGNVEIKVGTKIRVGKENCRVTELFQDSPGVCKLRGESVRGGVAEEYVLKWSDATAKDAFHHEIKVLNSLAGATGIAEKVCSNNSYVVLKHYDTDLFHCPLRDSREPEKAAQLFKQLMKTVRTLQNRGVVHGNIKPEHIFVQNISSDNYQFFLGDFSRAVVVQSKKCYMPRKINLRKFAATFPEHSKDVQYRDRVEQYIARHSVSSTSERKFYEPEEVVEALANALQPTSKELTDSMRSRFLFLRKTFNAEDWRVACATQGLDLNLQPKLDEGEKPFVTDATYDFLTPERRRLSAEWYDGSREDRLTVMTIALLWNLGIKDDKFHQLSDFLEDVVLRVLPKVKKDLSDVKFDDLAPVSYDKDMEEFRFTANGGEYLYVEHLGQGGGGEVYKVWDVAQKKHGAVKYGNNTEHVTNEQAMLSLLWSKPGIVQLLSKERSGSSESLLLELYDGGDFCLQENAELNDSTAPGERQKVASKLFSALTTALGNLKECGIVHGDIKPENILRRWSSEEATYDYFLADFGVARRPADKSGICFQPAGHRTADFSKFIVGKKRLAKLQAFIGGLKNEIHSLDAVEDILYAPHSNNDESLRVQFEQALGQFARSRFQNSWEQECRARQSATGQLVLGFSPDFLTPKRRQLQRGEKGGTFNGFEEDRLVCIALVVLANLGLPEDNFHKLCDFLVENGFTKEEVEFPVLQSITFNDKTKLFTALNMQEEAGAQSNARSYI